MGRPRCSGSRPVKAGGDNPPDCGTSCLLLKLVAAGQAVGDAANIHDPGGPGVPGLVVSMAKLLLVEDDEAVRSVLRQAIELAGHEVTCVGRHADAKAAMTKERYALLVADARLPDGSGRALAEHAAQSGLKAVLLSGHPDELGLTTLGRAHCLQKPFRIDDLLAAIEQVLDTDSYDAATSGSEPKPL